MLRSLPKLNYNISAKEIYLKFSEEPSQNINPTINFYLNKSKKNIDTYQSEWDNTKKYTNDYEFVGSNVPGTKHSISKIKPLSRAFYKLIEIFYSSNLIKGLKRQPLESFHLAEGPGGFIEALLYMRNNSHDRYYGMTLIDDKNKNKNIPGWKKSDQFLQSHSNVFIETGEDGTGNLYNSENLKSCIRKYKNSMEIITADGGFDFSIDYNKQEVMAIRLIFTQIVYALHLQKRGGVFIIKFFDTFTKASIDMIYILSCMYERVEINKPKSSRMANSEKYLVCKNFRYDNVDHISQKLIQIIKILENIDPNECFISSFLKTPWQLLFKNKITDINSVLTQQQITTIFKTIKLIENKERKIDKVNKLKQTNVQKCIKWCVEHNIPYNNDMPKVNIFLNRTTN